MTILFRDLLTFSLWDICAEQHALNTQFLPRPARKELNVPKLKGSKVLNVQMYVYTVLDEQTNQ